MPTSSSKILLLAALVSASSALAEAPPGKLEVKLEKKVDDEATMKKRASDAVNGYYKALIAGDYDAAATFLRTDVVEPIRFALIKQIEAAPPAQQKATFDVLGVPDLNALKAMPYTKLFAAYARSPYGASIQQLALKDVGAAVVVDEVTCEGAEARCTVKFKVGGKARDGSMAWVPQTMQASRVDGRWMLGYGAGATAP